MEFQQMLNFNNEKEFKAYMSSLALWVIFKSKMKILSFKSQEKPT